MSTFQPLTFAALWESLLPIGRDDRSGGYRRFCWTPAELECRAWFETTAAQRDLRTHGDRNGNLWAWWDVAAGEAGADAAGPAGGSGGSLPRASTGSGGSSPRAGTAVAVGSHLDSVPDGGAFDGPLGVVCAFAAIDVLREEGFVPARPIAVAAFAEEEGGRFGVACLGSRLLTGAIDANTARGLRDGDGITLAEAMRAAGHDPARIGPDEDLIARLGAYVELHIEQGRALADLDAALGIGEGIWPHGRWRLDFTGRADHAGTAALAGRSDPMLPYAATVLAARQVAAQAGTLATIGKVVAEPGAANAVCSSVRAWLDARAPGAGALNDTVDRVLTAAAEAAHSHAVTLSWMQESVTPLVEFDAGLRDRLAATLAARGIAAPALPTGAGHDAGVLAARLPTAMLFVRNPTGVSHSPAEHAEDADCLAGVTALAAVLREMAGS
ncbi:MAG TPA: allantoate amidohydrolase [Streptosporangiaceae bacterium]|nr:allantoate amidohydrolase [Streptosporangiaceae bacterium]